MKRAWMYVLSGGLLFWLPDVFAKALGAVSVRDVRILSGVCPAALLGGYLLTKAWKYYGQRWYVSFWMLVGVWILGPAMMSITSALRGASWAHPTSEWLGNFLVFAIATIFPPLTFIYSAYDGTLTALVIATVLMCVEIARQVVFRLRHGVRTS